jgi:hypothetical protein
MSMPDPVMVLCVDGPARGRLRAVTSSSRTRFQVYDMAVLPATDLGNEDMTLSKQTYHVHEIHMFGFVTRIASLQIDQNKIDPYDVISTLYSEAGRQATYRVK